MLKKVKGVGLAWLCVALYEQEFRKVSALFEDRDWVITKVFALEQTSSTVLYSPEKISRRAYSLDDDHAVHSTASQLADGRTIVQLIEGTKYDHALDSHWEYWGINVSTQPGGFDCFKVAERIAVILEGLGVPEEQMHIAHFATEASSATFQLERGSKF